jgi:hypothetical protein
VIFLYLFERQDSSRLSSNVFPFLVLIYFFPDLLCVHLYLFIRPCVRCFGLTRLDLPPTCCASLWSLELFSLHCFLSCFNFKLMRFMRSSSCVGCTNTNLKLSFHKRYIERIPKKFVKYISILCHRDGAHERREEVGRMVER